MGPPYHRLRVGVHDLLLAIDREGQAITVLRLHRMR